MGDNVPERELGTSSFFVQNFDAHIPRVESRLTDLDGSSLTTSQSKFLSAIHRPFYESSKVTSDIPLGTTATLHGEVKDDDRNQLPPQKRPNDGNGGAETPKR